MKRNACQKYVFAVRDDNPHCGLRGFTSSFNVEWCASENDKVPNGYELQEDGYFSWVHKKKEYPKTYEECCKVLDFCGDYFLTTYDAGCMVKKEVYGILQQVNSLTRLLICKLAYWKIAGEEMGLGKLWEPDYNNEKQPKYGIYDILKYSLINPSQFVFPTPEMRDAFYENFGPDLEFCKELL